MLSYKILEKFKIPGKLIKIEEKKSGLINESYIVTYLEDGKEKRYLAQRIKENTNDSPEAIMYNIEHITNYLKNKMEEIDNKKYKVLEIIKTKDNKNMYISKEDNQNKYYRVYKYIEGAVAYDKSNNSEIIYNVGKAFGNFQKVLQNYPIQDLIATNKDFHNTEKNLQDLLNGIKEDNLGRAKDIKEELEFILERKEICKTIKAKLDKGKLPKRIIHGDTKINNVMINEETKQFLAVIDLDTIMAGSSLYDYGDGIRSATAKQLNGKQVIDIDLFKAYTDGFFSEMAMYLKEEEIKLMGESIRVIALELGIRYLEDYINGDLVFNISYDTQNLEKAKERLSLVKDIEENMYYINSYIQESYKRHISSTN